MLCSTRAHIDQLTFADPTRNPGDDTSEQCKTADDNATYEIAAHDPLRMSARTSAVNTYTISIYTLAG